jgi:hypothetical protein
MDEFSYTVCMTPRLERCSPEVKLNAAQLWWKQCVGRSPNVTAAATTNGLICSPGVSVLRLFGKAFAFEEGRCSTYRPYVGQSPARSTNRRTAPAQIRLTRHNTGSNVPVVLDAVTQSCYQATFNLPDSLPPGSYFLETKSNLPTATWTQARDPDQRTLSVKSSENPYIGVRVQCTADAGAPLEAKDRATLLAALSTAAKRKGGATIMVSAGKIMMQASDRIVIPECVILKGAGMDLTELTWPDLSSACAGNKFNKPLIGPDPVGAGVGVLVDIAINAVVYKGCGAVVGVAGGEGFTLRRVNISMLDSMLRSHTYSSLVSISNAKHFLIENSVFLHW